MIQNLYYISIAFFAIFVGSQITEGVLLVPYWQSMSSSNFYSYYDDFGPGINQFYTVLTIVAALLPLFISVLIRNINKKAYKYSVASTAFAILFIATFYLYFKGANELYFEGALSDVDLNKELITWKRWHWSRVVLEIISLVLLVLSFDRYSCQNKV